MKEKDRINSFLYTDGNTALQLPEAWEAEDELMPKQADRQIMKNRAAHRAIPLKRVLFYALMTGIMLAAAVKYIGATANINRSLKNISNMQAELSALKAQNRMTEERLMAEIDLEEIYVFATEKLGMVYPDANERVTYTPHEREYVRQYEDIPTD